MQGILSQKSQEEEDRRKKRKSYGHVLPNEA